MAILSGGEIRTDRTDRKSKLKQAAALSYDAGKDDAPVIVAVGEGFVADKIVETAQEHDVPVVPDESLASVLAKFSVGDYIPEELYTVVAQVLLFISNIDDRYKGGKEKKYIPR